MWVEKEVGVGWPWNGRIMKWRRSGGEGRWQGQEKTMEMQIDSFDSIARLSFAVK